MSFKVTIKNFGKLTDATIRIGNFTVFAGQNSTGKSYASRGIYSLLGVLNSGLNFPIERMVDGMIFEIGEASEHLEQLPEELRQRFHDFVIVMKKLHDGYYDAREKSWTGIIEYAKSMKKDVESILEQYGKYTSDVHLWAGDSDGDVEKSENLLELLNDIGRTLVQIRRISSNPEVEMAGYAGMRFRTSLRRNFQIALRDEIVGNSDSAVSFSINDACTFSWDSGSPAIKMDIRDVHEIERISSSLSTMLLIESPIYWKLKPALDDAAARDVRVIGRRARRRNLVPGYYVDLARELRRPIIADDAEPAHASLFARIAEIIGGRLRIQRDGDIVYDTKEKAHSLSVVAHGIANLGMLGMILEKNLLSEGAFLFIDEPEAHLHPAWQIKMMEVLFDLSGPKYGVNVVIATHSADILKWLEVHIKDNPGSKDIVALNHFKNGRVEDPDGDFFDKLSDIQDDLTKPYQHLFIRGLRP